MVSLFSPAKHLSFSEVKELPALSFFQDLNINIYADKFSSSEVTEPLLAYFNYFPETIEDSRYRQEVATDLSDPDILESVSHFISGIGVAERYLQYSEKVTSSLQTWKWRRNSIATPKSIKNQGSDSLNTVSNQILSTDKTENNNLIVFI